MLMRQTYGILHEIKYCDYSYQYIRDFLSHPHDLEEKKKEEKEQYEGDAMPMELRRRPLRLSYLFSWGALFFGQELPKPLEYASFLTLASSSDDSLTGSSILRGW